MGNEPNAAGLEIAMGGLEIKMNQATTMALTGAECGAMVTPATGGESYEVSVSESFRLEQGDTLKVGFAEDGARAYLCVQGGVDVPEVLP